MERKPWLLQVEQFVPGFGDDLAHARRLNEVGLTAGADLAEMKKVVVSPEILTVNRLKLTVPS